MLPSLASLVDPDDVDAGARVAAAKRGRNAADRFPFGELTELKDLKTLRQDVLDLKSAAPYAIFAASADGIFVFRMRGDTSLTDLFDLDGLMNALILEYIRFREAKQTQEDPVEISCGSFNCFVKDVDIGADPDYGSVGVPMKQLALKMIPTTDVPAAVPDYVGLRLPKYLNNYASQEYKDKVTREAWGELSLTLHMAKLDLTPRILFAMPLFFEGGRGNSFAYVTESGWMALDRLLDTIDDPEALRLDRDHFASELVNLIQQCASQGVLLFDVKPGNMVAKFSEYSPQGLRYILKMIDFDDKFATFANRYSVQSGKYTSSNCVFVLNALLLLNYAVRYSTTSAFLLFGKLAAEMKRQWEMVRQDPGQNEFCVYLNQDQRFGQGFEVRDERGNVDTYNLGHPNLSERNGDNVYYFYERMRETFYAVLENYAEKNFLFEQLRHKRRADLRGIGYLSHVVSQVHRYFHTETTDAN